MADDNIRLMVLPIPVSATSGTTAFLIPAEINARANLYFEIHNPNSFDTALEGTSDMDSPLLVASKTVGWQIMARERMPVRASKRPKRISVAAVDQSGNPLLPGFDYTGCFVYLIYLMRGN